MKGQLGPLRRWMDQVWYLPNRPDISKSRVHELIVGSNWRFDLYDKLRPVWLERAFDHYGKAYTRIANVGDLSMPDHETVQIVKFHGDFEDGTSLVLDESSYFWSDWSSSLLWISNSDPMCLAGPCYSSDTVCLTLIFDFCFTNSRIYGKKRLRRFRSQCRSFFRQNRTRFRKRCCSPVEHQKMRSHQDEDDPGEGFDFVSRANPMRRILNRRSRRTQR